MLKQEQPNPANLLKRIGVQTPLIAFYDAPKPKLFGPLVVPKKGSCIFSFFKLWSAGKTLHLTKNNFGCGGAGRWMFGAQTRSRKEFLEFLVDHEGLKASTELMEKWIDSSKTYKARHPHLFIGPLKEGRWDYVVTVTFFVNPDQLSALMIGAQYWSSPDEPPPVIAPFGSGCMELQPFEDLAIPQASIGTTDIAMRHFLPPDILAFTVTRLMFKQLCELDERSFLYKPFLENLKKSRGLPCL